MFKEQDRAVAVRFIDYSSWWDTKKSKVLAGSVSRQYMILVLPLITHIYFFLIPGNERRLILNESLSHRVVHTFYCESLDLQHLAALVVTINFR